MYIIKHWNDLFETAETRKLQHLRWVPVPNKHDGKSFRRIANLQNGLDVFGAWMLILQIASKMPVRGQLKDEDGPITSEDMSLMTGFPKERFETAIQILSDPKIGWLETVPESVKSAPNSINMGGSTEIPASSPARPADAPERPASSPAEGKEGKEGNGKKVSDSPSASLKRQFTDLWCSSYEKFFSSKYLFQGAKDGTAADRLLTIETPENLISIARLAWELPNDFDCKHAASLAGFASRFNEIRKRVNFVKAPTKNTGPFANL